MQTSLVPENKINILKLSDYSALNNMNEFLLYSDNILEGIALLNDLTRNDEIMSLYGVVYEPYDQPIYVFEDKQKTNGNTVYYGIRICGSYDKWDLPEEVSKVIHYVDLPDYVFYSIKNKKVILAGENTETASVGNSQWQREGRKLGAARLGVPFIYQTFYSGKDESQNTIREPSSLQVYNQLVYTIRYKTPSFVAYFRNNFAGSNTRVRKPVDSQDLFVHYIKSVLRADVAPASEKVRKIILEKKFFKHMISYLKECKYTDIQKANPKPRLIKDLPCINSDIYDELINSTTAFVDRVIDYLYETDPKIVDQYKNDSKLLEFNTKKYSNWNNSYDEKLYIEQLYNYLRNNKKTPKSYIGKSKVGFADTELSKAFLCSKFNNVQDCKEINRILDPKKYPDCLLLPLRIYKKKNKKNDEELVFSPDPESGEIVAFAELFSIDLKTQKRMPVIGYCIIDTPDDFDIQKKEGTKLYKAIAKYVDILIIKGKQIYFSLKENSVTGNYTPKSILDPKPKEKTEEMAVVSAFLNQTTISSDCQLCFIHTHHSSWEQLLIHKKTGDKQEKINRVSTKVDLIMQKDNIFMIAEGKNGYSDFFKDGKIKKAMKDTSKNINDWYEQFNVQFDALIYNLVIDPGKELSVQVNEEVDKINKDINTGRFDKKVYHDSYVIIFTYLDNNETKFKLVYSPKFDNGLKKMLDKDFNQ